MALESATYIGDLVATNPVSSDPKSEGDNHIRLLKSTLQATFPNVTGATTATHTDLSSISGKAPIASPTFTGVVTVPTPTTSTGAATKSYVDAISVAAGNVPPGGSIRQVLAKNSSTDYDMSWSVAGVTRVARTSNTTLGVANSSNLIDITSGTFTQTFDAVATLGSGWFCYLLNSGTGDITLDPNASETIDGLTSYVMYPGECRLIYCDGSVLRSIVLNSFYRTFTVTGTFTKPPGYLMFDGLIWGGGTSGQSSGQNVAGGGGGSCAKFSFPYASVSTSESVTIGSGGLATATASKNAGGNSTFKTVTAYGSNGGSAGGNSLVNGVASSNTLLSGVPDSSYYGGGSSTASAQPVGSIHGGGAGAGISSTPTAFSGGTSVFGGAGGYSSLGSTVGGDGTAPGGGGGNSQSGNSGAGARGELRIWGVI